MRSGKWICLLAMATTGVLFSEAIGCTGFALAAAGIIATLFVPVLTQST